MEELLKESKSEGSKVCEVRKFQPRSFGWEVIERYDGLKVDRQNDISTLALYLGDWKKAADIDEFWQKGHFITASDGNRVWTFIRCNGSYLQIKPAARIDYAGAFFFEVYEYAQGPVEKPVFYQKCWNCNQTAYLKAKERYDTQREKLAGRYKAKTVMYEALIFLLIWYSISTTLFQMIRSKIFISDCVVFFDTIATFTQTIAGWVVLTGKTVAQISNGISNPVVAGIIYWLIKILVYSGCLVGAGILVVFIWMKIAGLYKKYCWDMITVMVILISMAITIYFGDSIKTVLPINLLFLLLFVQLVYVGIRWYVKGWRENRGYV